jgi:hypothetical protein
MEEEIKSLSIVEPALTTQKAIEKFKNFREIKEKVLSEEDKEPIKGKPYIRKTGWRKIKTIFNLGQEILSSTRRDIGDGNFSWIFRVRVIAPNGVYTDAEMSCDSLEDFSWMDKEHTKKKPESAVMAMAQTRAYNRAISDLVGGGEVSAEEMTQVEKEEIKELKKCIGCGADLSEKVYSFSMENFETPLCLKCQGKKREK